VRYGEHSGCFLPAEGVFAGLIGPHPTERKHQNGARVPSSESRLVFAGVEAAPRGGETGKSLKDQNRWQLWIIVAANSLFLYGVVQANAIKADGLP
jgi:hypothetical protein